MVALITQRLATSRPPALLRSKPRSTRTAVRNVSLYVAYQIETQSRKDRTASRTLRAGMSTVRTRKGAKVFIPHFWATAYHEGRGRVNARKGHVIAFFTDPLKDPRRPGGITPVKKKGYRKLTKDEFDKFRGTEGFVITKSVKEFKGNPFVVRAANHVVNSSLYRLGIDLEIERQFTVLLDKAAKVSAKNPNKKFRKASCRISTR
jgi:hypothetical protein